MARKRKWYTASELESATKAIHEKFDDLEYMPVHKRRRILHREITLQQLAQAKQLEKSNKDRHKEAQKLREKRDKIAARTGLSKLAAARQVAREAFPDADEAERERHAESIRKLK